MCTFIWFLYFLFRNGTESQGKNRDGLSIPLLLMIISLTFFCAIFILIAGTEIGLPITLGISLLLIVAIYAYFSEKKSVNSN